MNGIIGELSADRSWVPEDVNVTVCLFQVEVSPGEAIEGNEGKGPGGAGHLRRDHFPPHHCRFDNSKRILHHLHSPKCPRTTRRGVEEKGKAEEEAAKRKRVARPKVPSPSMCATFWYEAQ